MPGKRFIFCRLLPLNFVKSATPKLTSPVKKSLRELTEQAILQQFTPVAALVGAKGEILYLHGRSGCYLEPPPGEAGIIS